MSEAEPFYDQNAEQEWGRLERHRTEFAVTLRALVEFLPQPPCAVLDIGGGPGRYSIELARRGYTVTLADVSSESLKLAREKAAQASLSLNATIHVDARDLDGIAAASFDAVLLMGPLYHLLDEKERVQAVQEALRVLKSGGRLFAALITRFAPFRNAAVHEPEWLIENPAYAERMLETGLHPHPTEFAAAYFARPEEVTPLMEGCGLETLLLLGCEGVVAGHEQTVNGLEGETWEAWVELNYRLGQEPSLWGAADHLLYVGQKPA